jgi:uncharacterized protein
MINLSYVLLGILAGIMSGLFGIGGGLIIIPILIYIYGFSQHQAQGTTLAIMIPPIGLLAAWVYYKQGYINIPIALFVCAGFIIGGFVGAKYAAGLQDVVMRRTFGVFLLLVSLHMIFKS